MRLKPCKRYRVGKSYRWKTLKHSWVLRGNLQVCVHCRYAIQPTKKFLKELEHFEKESKKFRKKR